MKTNDRMRTWLTRLSLAAGILFTAHAEYDLARTLGADPWIAAMLPVAIDAYVVAALRWFRGFDITLSLALMGAAQVAAHMLDAKVMTVNIPMVIVVSLLVPVAIWRTHALARGEHDVPAEAPAPVPDEPERNLHEELAAVQIEREYGVDPTPALEAYPAIETTVLAAEETRTRTEVRAEYVPDPVPEVDDEPVVDPDPLVPQARGRFAEVLAAGDVPGVRTLRGEYGIGQPRAQRIRDALKEAL
ncbi:hypothetical protein ACFVY9_00535 [Streptomyces sp. NPDC059544]|uniref:hypothetical protein n=1 Tax=Streptomyces sp. NPDC059544 TaxID=3346861 RepID=UPI00369B4B54